MNVFRIISSHCVVLLLGSVCQADLVLGLAFDDATTSKSVASGTTVFVDMFLTDTDGSTSLSTDGLLNAGGQLLQTSGTATVASAGLPQLGTNAGPGFDPSTLVQLGLAGSIDDFSVASLFPDTVGIGALTVHLARFQLIATGAVGESAVITSATLGIDPGTGFPFIGNLSGVGEDLDAVLTGIGAAAFGSVDLTISSSAAVPEPSTMLVASLLCAGYLVRRKRMAANQA